MSLREFNAFARVMEEANAAQEAANDPDWALKYNG